ncbi:MAG: hypothetical protein IV092_09245 [Burkholderiaceae bacterium]|nr:hypothetical protein [Burkholderiaceae bacterium]
MSQSSSHIVLACVLTVVRPLARLLLRNGVTYTAFSQALKPVFLQAAHDELNSLGRPTTDSAVSLLSGVHRRDVRNLTRLAPEEVGTVQEPASLVSQVVARWLHSAAFSIGPGKAKVLPRSGEGSFDQLVTEVSRDVRPRAVLDELQRLGVAAEEAEGVRMLTAGFIPRKGLQEMASLFADNLHDHLAAASLNLQGETDFLEQALFVDEITEISASQLQKVSVLAWKQAFKSVMAEAQERFDSDALNAKAEDRTHRARFGVYFYSDKGDRP